MDPSTAPLTLWLQGGPGSSSLFGVFEVNGPFRCIYNEANNTGQGRDTQLDLNPYSWTREVNMIYLDQPAGTGQVENTKMTYFPLFLR